VSGRASCSGVNASRTSAAHVRDGRRGPHRGAHRQNEVADENLLPRRSAVTWARPFTVHGQKT
jgi:hypothetical protein